jgi:hypothetical protein
MVVIAILALNNCAKEFCSSYKSFTQWTTIQSLILLNQMIMKVYSPTLSLGYQMVQWLIRSRNTSLPCRISGVLRVKHGNNQLFHCILQSSLKISDQGRVKFMNRKQCGKFLHIIDVECKLEVTHQSTTPQSNEVNQRRN